MGTEFFIYFVLIFIILLITISGMNILAISEQRISSIHFEILKNLKDVTIDLSGSELTAIMGVNGSGKSTILHALACCYKPIDDHSDRENYKLSEFFTPNTDSLWDGSKFSIKYSYRNGREYLENVYQEYTKSDRWNPKYQRRPVRNVIFIGIKTCVPRIEDEKQNTFIRYVTSSLTDDISRQVREKASYVMNREYSSYSNNKSSRFEYIGVEHSDNHYTSLSMGAGEQRIFHILTKIFNAPKNSLILIDEIDLLLHEDALKRLIEVIKNRANTKSHQVVFTTHAQSVTTMSDSVNIRHVYNTPMKTLCFNETKPDAIYRLTGSSLRPLEIFVEDDLSKVIVNTVCSEMDMQRFVSVKKFGAAENSFTLACGMLVLNKDIRNALFLLDGDVFKTQEDRERKINSIFTGNDPILVEIRNEALKSISEYNLPDGQKPERYIRQLITTLPDDVASQENEIKRVALEIQQVDVAHKFVDEIIFRLGIDEKVVGLHKVVDLASRSNEWLSYTLPLREWLEKKKIEVMETEQAYASV
jgi:ABC-type lipoprotein export system ATPase subunit